MTQDEEALLLRRGAATVAGGFAIRFSARLIFLLTAALLYGAAVYGAFGIAVAVIEVCVTVGGLGMKKLLFQHLDDPNRTGSPITRLLDAGLMVLLASGLLALLLGCGAGLLRDDGLTGLALIWMAPMIAAQSLLDLLLAATRWHRQVRYEVLARSVVEPYVGVAASLLAYWLGWRELGLVAGYWAGTLAATAFALFGVLRAFDLGGLSGHRPRVRSLLLAMRGNILNVASDLANGLANRFDLYLVGLLLGEAAAGVYSVARQICIPLRQVRQSFDSLLTPIVSRDLSRLGPGPVMDRIGGVTRQLLGVQLPLLLLFAGVGQPALALLEGNFGAAYLPMLILAMGEILQASFGITELLFAYRAPARGLAITLGSIGLGIIACFLLVPVIGLNGAAVALLLGYGARALIRRQMIGAGFGVLPPLGPLLPLAAAALAGGAAVATGKALFAPTAILPALLVTAVAVMIFLLVRRVAAPGR